MFTKKSSFRTLFALMAVFTFFASCKKIVLNEHIPQLKGSWHWVHTSVGGFVGVVYPDSTQNLILTFEDGNKISIDYNGERLFESETYTVSKSNNSLYGDYIITLPKKIKTKVAECLDHSEGSIVLDGYVNIVGFMPDPEPSSSLTQNLFITNKKEIIGIEDGNYHKRSMFVSMHELH